MVILQVWPAAAPGGCQSEFKVSVYLRLPTAFQTWVFIKQSAFCLESSNTCCAPSVWLSDTQPMFMEFNNRGTGRSSKSVLRHTWSDVCLFLFSVIQKDVWVWGCITAIIRPECCKVGWFVPTNSRGAFIQLSACVWVHVLHFFISQGLSQWVKRYSRGRRSCFHARLMLACTYTVNTLHHVLFLCVCAFCTQFACTS